MPPRLSCYRHNCCQFSPRFHCHSFSLLVSFLVCLTFVIASTLQTSVGVHGGRDRARLERVPHLSGHGDVQDGANVHERQNQFQQSVLCPSHQERRCQQRFQQGTSQIAGTVKQRFQQGTSQIAGTVKQRFQQGTVRYLVLSNSVNSKVLSARYCQQCFQQGTVR